jgi:hypothetical protein
MTLSYGTSFADANTKVVVLSDGNVGIGTTFPSGKLEVVGNGLFSGVVTADSGSTSFPFIAKSTGTRAGIHCINEATTGTDNIAEIRLSGYDDVVPSLGIVGQLFGTDANNTDSAFGKNTVVLMNHRIDGGIVFSTGIGNNSSTFSTANITAIIDASGNMGVGTEGNTLTEKFEAVGNIKATTGVFKSTSTGDNYMAGNLAVGKSSVTTGYTLDVAGEIRAKFLRLDDNGAFAAAPSSASDTGLLGEVRLDTGYIYLCVGTNTWRRVAINTW